jgi:hypothetical protein
MLLIYSGANIQRAFRIWQLAQGQDGIRLNQLMKKAGISSSSPTGLPAEVPTTPFNIAKDWVCNQINRQFSPGISLPRRLEACYLPSCPVGRIFPELPQPSGHLTYALMLVAGRGGPQVEPRLKPSTLLKTIWLQFADLVCGRRTIRICEVCKELMDITDAAHRNSKRMHDRCSRRVRMQRYRENMKKC